MAYDGVLNRVSILVLMDVVREVFPDGRMEEKLWCFNPCSNGCRSGSRSAAPVKTYDSSVSILVLMDVVREAVQPLHADTKQTMFQSLF